MANLDYSFEALGARMPLEAARGLMAFRPGPFAGGFIRFVTPDVLDETLADWLGGFSPSRTPFARTALGDMIYVRDLRERARSIGMTGTEAEAAHDVSVLDVRYKETRLAGFSFAEFAANLADPEWLAGELRKDLYDAAVDRLGRPGIDEIYAFVPALALGGAENPANLERSRADVALSLLLQA